MRGAQPICSSLTRGMVSYTNRLQLEPPERGRRPSVAWRLCSECAVNIGFFGLYYAVFATPARILNFATTSKYQVVRRRAGIFASYDFWLFPPTPRSCSFSECLWTLGFPCRISRIPRQSILMEVATISEAFLCPLACMALRAKLLHRRRLGARHPGGTGALPSPPSAFRRNDLMAAVAINCHEPDIENRVMAGRHIKSSSATYNR